MSRVYTSQSATAPYPIFGNHREGEWVLSPTAPAESTFNPPNAGHGLPPDYPLVGSLDTTAYFTHFGQSAIAWDQLLPAPTAPMSLLHETLDAMNESIPLGLTLENPICFEGHHFAPAQPDMTMSGYPSLGTDLCLDPWLGPLLPIPTAPELSIDNLNASDAPASDLYAFEGSWVSNSSDGSQTTATTPFSSPATPLWRICDADPQCSETFTSLADLKKHERKHKQNPLFSCTLCGKQHSCSRNLERHLWTKHKEHARRLEIRSEKIKCRWCDYEARADNVRRHEMNPRLHSSKHSQPSDRPPKRPRQL